MKIGIGLPSQVRDVDATVIPAWAAKAEEAGFSSLGTVGRIAYPALLDTVALAAAAGATRTIGLLSTVMLAPVWPATLLAKELAGIQAVSGGRLTFGVGVGGRPDDFVVEGTSTKGLGKRMDAALDAYRDLWSGKPVGGGDNAGVPGGSVDVPMLFGGFAPAALRRMARFGEGYIAGALPAPQVVPVFDAAREAWRTEGRDGEPRLVAIAYFALGDPDRGRANAHHYYSVAGPDFANLVSSGVNTTADALRTTVAAFTDIGADELVFHPTTDDLTDVTRLADLVL
ncbi:LLM class flavin-dependent oxidoreductase [Amycolatopsis rhabdoformis]|uniref:LLM class flavin-dependent oxidoreductase n=1 Tax=Amycolatopsis rhabdoformis TaxID=1448059 RepID=A0ABZ1IH41_9PSEU|nr:LLM class flavin-dependent oxidoreductase [Amycolatopsis rhabdoformis]WSE33740.1 LLM class flavin-dependent oxidoreductase [Amycolatopsis rhabdoformis]